MSLPLLSGAHAHCFFFDFDGTLTEIAETPWAVQLQEQARETLQRLVNLTSGAVAIVTGREIEAVDQLVTPLKLPMSGVHGLERRNGGGVKSLAAASTESAKAVAERLRAFVADRHGLLLEEKRGAVALHYRNRAELEEECLREVEAAVASQSGVVLTRGKMVIEARFHKANKGTAIEDFLNEAPFKGRVPVFAGDDVTDEDGFVLVNERGGLSIKVGPGETCARARAESVAEFLNWLKTIVQD